MHEPAHTTTRFSTQGFEAGITRIVDVTGLDKIGIPVVASHRPMSHSVSVSMGKGVDLHSAYASALMEGIELYQAESIPRSRVHHRTCEGLALKNLDFQTEGLLLSSVKTSLPNNIEYDWIAGTNLITGNNIFVPYDAVHTNYRSIPISGRALFQSSTNGLASGNSTDEATVHAICEIVERDAISIWDQSPAAYKYSGCVDPTTIDSAMYRATLEKLSKAGIIVRILDITSDISIPVFMVVLIDPELSNSNPARIVYGSGCHLRKDIALSRAITEAAQVRLTMIISSREDIPNSVYSGSNYGLEQAYDYLVMLPNNDYRHIPNASFASIEEELDYALSIISERARKLDRLNKIIRVNLETKRLRVPTVKVMIPFLENPSDEYGYKPGPRIQKYKKRWKSMHF